MKVYYLLQIFGELQKLGKVDVLKYHPISGGWHVVIRDMSDKNKHEYELTIIPRPKPEEHEDLLKLFSQN